MVGPGLLGDALRSLMLAARRFLCCGDCCVPVAPLSAPTALTCVPRSLSRGFPVLQGQHPLSCCLPAAQPPSCGLACPRKALRRCRVAGDAETTKGAADFSAVSISVSISGGLSSEEMAQRWQGQDLSWGEMLRDGLRPPSPLPPRWARALALAARLSVAGKGGASPH